MNSGSGVSQSHQHTWAVLAMVATCLLWSTAGVVTRFLHGAGGFEVTFWRSFVSGVTVLLALPWLQNGVEGQDSAWWSRLRDAHVWASGACWAVMFTCFMLAMTQTAVANVLITQSLGPIITALLSALVLRQRINGVTGVAIGVAAAGIASMYVFDLSALNDRSIRGVMIAFCVPCAAAINWVVMQRVSMAKGRSKAATGGGQDLTLSVVIGSLMSAAVTLPLAWPLRADAHDILLLSALGVFQLALPCMWVVRLTRHLTAPELSLLGLLEVIMGIVLAWLFADERPATTTLWGGATVILTLAWHEWYLGRRRSLAMSKVGVV